MYSLIVEIYLKTLHFIKANILKIYFLRKKVLLPKVTIFNIKEMPGDLTLYLVNA